MSHGTIFLNGKKVPVHEGLIFSRFSECCLGSCSESSSAARFLDKASVVTSCGEFIELGAGEPSGDILLTAADRWIADG